MIAKLETKTLKSIIVINWNKKKAGQFARL